MFEKEKPDRKKKSRLKILGFQKQKLGLKNHSIRTKHLQLIPHKSNDSNTSDLRFYSYTGGAALELNSTEACIHQAHNTSSIKH